MDKIIINHDINSLLSKFDNGLELYQNNVIFNNCIESLLRGADIYKTLEQIIVMQTETQQRYLDLVRSGILKQTIVLTKERFEQVEKEFNNTTNGNNPD